MGVPQRQVRVTIRRPERRSSSNGVSRRVQEEDGSSKGDVATDRGVQVLYGNETRAERINQSTLKSTTQEL